MYVAYYESSTGKLKLADNFLEPRNCGPGGNTWQCIEITDMGILTLDSLDDYYTIRAGLSMDLDLNQAPLIAYMDLSGMILPGRLSIARSAWASGLLTGNCGPSNSWQCKMLDTPSYHIYEADYAALAISPNGLGMIAYSENRGAQLNTWRLKLAYQAFMVYLPALTK
jgi:hypothetical protein